LDQLLVGQARRA